MIPAHTPRTAAARREARARTAYRVLRTTRWTSTTRRCRWRPSSRWSGAALARTSGYGATVAKLSIVDAAFEAFDDLQDLITSVPDEEAMTAHEPPIGVASTSNRVVEERRNVRVRAFLYAASREDDNDFHLIVGEPRPSHRST